MLSVNIDSPPVASDASEKVMWVILSWSLLSGPIQEQPNNFFLNSRAVSRPCTQINQSGKESKKNITLLLFSQEWEMCSFWDFYTYMTTSKFQLLWQTSALKSLTKICLVLHTNLLWPSLNQGVVWRVQTLYLKIQTGEEKSLVTCNCGSCVIT